MTAAPCGRISFAELVDYTAGLLSEVEATALEDHLFSCADCGAHAIELDALARSIALPVRAGEVGGFVTDAVLNRLAREGVRLRTFCLSPGDVVPCAVWEDDELMALRLRAEFGDATEVTLSQRVAGEEMSRTTGYVVPSRGEIIFATPASWVRQFPVVEVEFVMTVRDGEGERPVGSYTLLHGGALRR